MMTRCGTGLWAPLALIAGLCVSASGAAPSHRVVLGQVAPPTTNEHETTLVQASQTDTSPKYFIRVLPHDGKGARETYREGGVIDPTGVVGSSTRLLGVLAEPTDGAKGAEKPKSAEPKTGDTPAAGSAATRPVTPPPTLDELLGLGKPTGSGSQSALPNDPANAKAGTEGELERLLSGQQLADAFEEAVTLMGDASTRLRDRADPGLDTQRVQEDIIKKLEIVLESMQQQQQQQQQQSKQQRQPQPQQNPGSQKRPQQSQQNQASPSNDSQAQSAPGKKEGELRPGLESARAAWGALPERVRDMLLQGAGDRFSSRYQGLTEAYYKRLAEEKDRK